MLYREFGDFNQGRNVSVIGLGCEGMLGRSDAQIKELIDTAVSNGINYLDISVPNPNLLKIIGNALHIGRKKLIIAAHLCTVFEDGECKITYDLEKTKASFENIMKILGTDYIDVGMIHCEDRGGDIGSDFNNLAESGVIDYAEKLKAEGVIRHIGICLRSAASALKFVTSGIIDVLMFPVNAAYDFSDGSSDVQSPCDAASDEGTLTPNAQRIRLYAECERRGICIAAVNASASGVLYSENSNPFGRALTTIQCIEYALSRPGVVSVISECSSSKDIMSDILYCTANDKTRNFSHIFADNPRIAASRRCMYCSHCRPCASNIDIPKVTKYLDLALMDEDVPESVMRHYKELEFNAMDCLMCGSCERKCPFGVHVMDNMMRAQRVFHSDFSDF